MQPSSYGKAFPSTAHYLALVGGILIVIEGLIDIVAAAALSSYLESIVAGLTGLVIVLGVIGLIVGVLIIYLSTRLRSNPAGARTNGIMLIILSFVSLFTVSGFFLGFILVLIGGILAVTWKSPAAAQTAYGSSAYNPPGTMAPGPWGTPSAPPSAPGVPQKFCPSCGSPNAADAKFCAKCGAPLS